MEQNYTAQTVVLEAVRTFTASVDPLYSIPLMRVGITLNIVEETFGGGQVSIE